MHTFLTLYILSLKVAIWPQLTLNVNFNLHAALKVFCQHHIMLLYFLHLMPKLWENCNLKLYNIANDCIYTNTHIIILLNIKYKIHSYRITIYNSIFKDILILQQYLLRKELKDCCNFLPDSLWFISSNGKGWNKK